MTASDRMGVLEDELTDAHGTIADLRDALTAAERQRDEAVEAVRGMLAEAGAWGDLKPGRYAQLVVIGSRAFGDGQPPAGPGQDSDGEPDVRPRDGEPGWLDVTCGACGAEHGTNFTLDQIACYECGAHRCPNCRTWFDGGTGQ